MVRKLDCFFTQVREETTTLLGPLEREVQVTLNHVTQHCIITGATKWKPNKKSENSKT
jgi:hypothetical protein